MSFKEQLISSLKKRYQEEISLQEIFDEIRRKLYQLEEELEEFTRYGLDVELDLNSDSAKLTIEDFYLLFEFFYDDDPPCIQVTCGDEEHSHLIDKIGVNKNHLLIVAYRDSQNIEKAFDYYLQKAFSKMLDAQ